jgi:hypothetical protein
MRRLALSLMLLCAALLPAAAMSGCMGDDGLNRDEPALDQPSGAASDPLYESGGTNPVQKRKRGHRKAKRNRKHGRGAVASAHARRSARGRKPIRRPKDQPSSGFQLGSVGKPIDNGSDGEKYEGPPSARPLNDGEKLEVAAVQDTLHDLFRRMNARDASLCTDLFTERHLRESTGTSGQAAVERCQNDVSSSRTEYGVNRVDGVRIEGDEALIQFASSAGPYAKTQILRLLKTDHWRFDGDGSEAAREGL